MSIRLMAQVWEIADPELNGARLLTLLSLADHANDEGTNCYPSIPRLAKRAKISDRQAKRVIQWLEQAGYIAVIERGGGRGKSTDYHVLPNGDTVSRNSQNKGDTVSRNRPKKGVTGDIKGDICDIKGDTGDTRSIIEPSIEPSRGEAEGAARRPAAAAIDPDTAMVWDKWQRNMPGVITEIIAAKINELIDDYGAQDVVRGITIQAERGKQTAGVRYLEGILRKGINSTPVYDNKLSGPAYANGSAPRSKIEASLAAVDFVFDQLERQEAQRGQ